MSGFTKYNMDHHHTLVYNEKKSHISQATVLHLLQYFIPVY